MWTTYHLRGLPDGSHAELDFEFVIDDGESPFHLRIPGDQRGPDVCLPDSADQESWLDSRPDLLVRVWDCQWRFVDVAAQEQFMRILRDG